MFSTPITRAFGLTTPTVNAGMAMVARPELPAAVSNAGALGTIGCDVNPISSASADMALQPGFRLVVFRKPMGVMTTSALRERGAGKLDSTTSMGSERVPLPRFSAILPTHAFDGEIAYACLTSGQSVGRIDPIRPAAGIVRTMTNEAMEVVSRLFANMLSGGATA